MLPPLFAAVDGGCLCMLWFLLAGFILACVGGFRLWLMVNRPQIYRDMVRREHEQKMAQLEQRRTRYATARQVASVAGVFARIFLGGR